MIEKSIFVTLGINGFSFLPKSSLKKVISKEPVRTFLLIEFSKISNFSYRINNKNLNKLHSPFFKKIDYKSIDPRCFFLKKYINKNLSNSKFSNMKEFSNLWRIIETNANNTR